VLVVYTPEACNFNYAHEIKKKQPYQPFSAHQEVLKNTKLFPIWSRFSGISMGPAYRRDFTSLFLRLMCSTSRIRLGFKAAPELINNQKLSQN
jgi:hypothetical protein